MTYSKIHQAFSERLKEPEALTNPEMYLGPNWEDVLNFWFYVEGLSEQEQKEMNQLFLALDDNVRDSAIDAADGAAHEVVDCWKFIDDSWDAAYDVTECGVFGWATLELIGHHKLLDQNKTPLALQWCVKS